MQIDGCFSFILDSSNSDHKRNVNMIKIVNSNFSLNFFFFKAQRSAQELPQIEKYSINSCSVNGGHEMVVTGSNFLPESKIIFFEKGQGKYYLTFFVDNQTKNIT